MGSDLSVPRGDRDPTDLRSGPAKARAALAKSGPPPFRQQVADLATERGWEQVASDDRRLCFVRGDVMVVAQIGASDRANLINETLWRLRRVRVVRTAQLNPSEGLGPVREALKTEAEPIGEPDGGRRGD
jgi:hypothetical protein